MQFGSKLMLKVLDGTKTMTRRKRKTMDCPYRVGRDYAVTPGRGQKAVGRVEILNTRWERLSDLTDEDAQQEGFDDVAAFFAYWKGLHGKVDKRDQVWVITFKAV